MAKKETYRRKLKNKNANPKNMFHVPCFVLCEKRGQLMIEAIVAITVLVIGLVGVFTLLSQSFRYNRYVADDYTAIYLAAEGIEVVKNLLDANTLSRRPWGCGFADGSYELEYYTAYNSDPPDCNNPYAALQVNQSRKLNLRSSNGVYAYTGGSGWSPTGFTRTVIIKILLSGPTREIQVNSIARWKDGSVNLEDRFFDWYP